MKGGLVSRVRKIIASLLVSLFESLIIGYGMYLLMNAFAKAIESGVISVYEIASLLLGLVITYFSYRSYMINEKLYNPELTIYRTRGSHILMANQGEIPIAILSITAKVGKELVPLTVSQVVAREGRRQLEDLPIPFVVKAKDFIEIAPLFGLLRVKHREKLKGMDKITLVFEYKTIEDEPKKYEFTMPLPEK